MEMSPEVLLSVIAASSGLSTAATIAVLKLVLPNISKAKSEPKTVCPVTQREVTIHGILKEVPLSINEALVRHENHLEKLDNELSSQKDKATTQYEEILKALSDIKVSIARLQPND